MSAETLQWLNQNCLIGYTDKRGTAWHYKQSEQGSEPNHYPGQIPIEDVRRRLFHWEAVEAQVQAIIPPQITPEGVSDAVTILDPTRKAIIRPDTQAILGIFKDGYKIHQYDEWLLKQIAHLLDDDGLQIGSAGLLRGGGVAWVSVEVPESIVTPEGVEFRPFLTAGTSHDGTLATTFKRGVSLPVCDNTLSAALHGASQRIKVKHSKYSTVKLQDARDALGIVHQTADDFSQQVADLCAVTVTDAQFEKFLSELAPVPEEDGRGKTIATNKQASVRQLWHHDDRVTPWKGTAFGVVQAVNTADHHLWTTRGNKAERNMLKAVTGGFDKLDADTLSTLDKVLAAA